MHVFRVFFGANCPLKLRLYKTQTKLSPYVVLYAVSMKTEIVFILNFTHITKLANLRFLNFRNFPYLLTLVKISGHNMKNVQRTL